jgi:GTPase SAR1 family protein
MEWGQIIFPAISLGLFLLPGLTTTSSIETTTLLPESTLTPTTQDDKLVVMVIGPTGAGKSSLLNALLCPRFRYDNYKDCHFETGSGTASITSKVEWRKGRWLGTETNENIPLVAYDTPGLGDTNGNDQATLRSIAETVEAQENGPFNAFFLVVRGEDRFRAGYQKHLRILEYIYGPDIWYNFILTFTWYGFTNGDIYDRKDQCMNENSIKYPDNFRQFCENFDNEEKILKEWQKSLRDFHGINDLNIPGVFVHSHTKWHNDYEVQMFNDQSEILLQEIRNRPGITCNSECIERMEISVRNSEKRPKILGMKHEFEDFGQILLLCNKYHGFDAAIDHSAQLNWIHNGMTIQNDPDLNIFVSRSNLHDITMVTNLTITDIDPSVGGTYECRYGTSIPQVVSDPITLKVVQKFVGAGYNEKSKREFLLMSLDSR